MNKTCVYTAIAGGYDQLKPHPDVPGVDWICFTDDDTLTSTEWDVRPLIRHLASPRLDAKLYKVLPSTPTMVPGGYTHSIWIDGSVTVLTPVFVSRVLEILHDHSMAMFRHPERDCIYDEAVASLDYKKYEATDVLGQVAEYRRMGFPRHAGLWAGTIIGRNHRSGITLVMEDWWREICRWGIQDQLSLPFVLRRFGGFQPGAIPGNLYDNALVKVDFAGHASDL
jgi:Protein of unknown function (DUF616)